MSEPVLRENGNHLQSSVGATLRGIILQEYLNKRDGDRFWYENNQFDTNELALIKQTTYRDVLARIGFNVTDYPLDVFTVPPVGSPLASCHA